MWLERLLWAVVLVLVTHPGLALDETPCRLEAGTLPSVYARCSTLTVPEDPEDRDGRSLDLFFARVPALSATPAPDPLVLISGGPGQSSVDLYLQLRGAFEPVRRQRDILLLDQRGTGRSAEGFECPTPEDLDFQMAAGEILDSLVRDCLGELDRDPQFFTTSVAIRDLEHLRVAIDADSWNLYGVSYGTRVAQHYLRRYPERVRTAILDGAVPADLILGPEIATNAQEVFESIVGRCAESPDCAERFGDLRAKLRELQTRLVTERPELVRPDPATGDTEHVDVLEQHLQGVVRLMSYSPTTAALLPLTIDEAYHGRYNPLVSQAEMFLGSIEQAVSFPMHNSVACSEDLTFIAPGDEAYGAGTYLGSTIMDALFAICDRWPSGLVDPDFKEPLSSDRPVLLLSGGNDPATPPRYAERIIAQGLGNALHVVAAEQGHGLAAVGCTPALMRDFIDAGHFDGLDTDCLDAEIASPFFLSASGPGP